MSESNKIISDLRETLGRMEIALDSIHEAILWIDEEGTIVWCNKSFDRLITRPHISLLGTDAIEVFPLENKSGPVPTELHPCRRLATIPDLPDALYQFRRSGKTLTLEISGSSTELTSGDRIITLIIRNVTSLRLSQEQLKQAKKTLEKKVSERTDDLYRLSRRYRNILEEAVDAIVTIDRQGIIVSFNPAAERIFNYTEKEVLGKNVSLLMPAPHRENHDGYIRNYLESGIRKIIGTGREVSGLRSDGSLVPLDLSVSESGYQDDRIFTGILRDISERKQAEAALEGARRDAEQASRVKSDFLARMSHEMRTPMNAILGMAELLLETGLTPEQQRYIQTFENAGNHLLSIVNDLLDLEKIEAGKFGLEAVSFELRSLLAETYDILSVSAQEKGLEIDFSISPDTPERVIGDPLRLQQVLINLIGNGIKFTEQGGIFLHVGRGAVPGDVDGPVGMAELRFEVRDTGAGIDATDIERIFDRFVQSRHGADRRHDGSGLGLAICKSLVRQMGGDIRVSSTPGQGSTFTFTCRLQIADSSENRKESEDQQGEQAPGAATLTAHAHILLAEDSADNRLLFEAFLKRLDCSLDIAVNGQVAIEKFKTEPFDLVLMDIEMPVLDGYSATRQIRAHEEEYGLARVPIIALSAHAADKEEARALEAGCDRYLSKPVKRDKLVEAICSLLNQDESGNERTGDETAAAATVIVEIDNLIEDLVPAFLKNRRDDIVKLREAVHNGDMEAVEFLGHTMKGTGGGYGFTKISELGLALERAAIAGDADTVLRHADELENYLNSLNIVFVEKGVDDGFNTAG